MSGDYRIGDRVQLHPTTDAWMQGDRYGTVEYVGKRGDWVRLLMDRSGRHLRFNARNILEVIEPDAIERGYRMAEDSHGTEYADYLREHDKELAAKGFPLTPWPLSLQGNDGE